MVPMQIHTTLRWGGNWVGIRDDPPNPRDPRCTTRPLPFADAASSAGPPARRINAEDAEKGGLPRII